MSPNRRVGVEVAGRLVADEQRRMVRRTRARWRRAAARRQRYCQGGEPILFENPTRCYRGLGDLLRICALDSPWTRWYVLGRRAARQELEILEDAAHVPAEQRHLRALQADEVATPTIRPSAGSSSLSI